MKVVVNEELLAEGAGLKMAEREPAALKPGEIRVRVRVASLTPADQMMIEGQYYFIREAPFGPGLVGVGDVVEHNAGLLGRFLMGKRVFFSPGYERDGAWAELAVADAKTVAPLKSDLEDDAAVSLGNALTAVGLIETARETGARAVVANAAAGNLAGLIASHAAERGMGFVGVVRKDAHAEKLKAAGITHVLNQTRDDFVSALSELNAKMGATFFIDSIGGGPTSVQMLEAMPKGSTAIVIGRLARQPLSIDALPLLLGRNLTLRAFGANEWISSKSLPAVMRAAGRAQNILRKQGEMPIQRRVSLDEVVANFGTYIRSTSAGRTLVYPGGVPG